ncbi:MAG: ABC transporter ATP-binding protein [Clostridia bacterium]|nr:ABC transporter ATP-binding protein [Oscillospiraceae bacterium]MBR2411978.1 ABC transporter ATP-binding protein [Clostridia bacterium]
MSFIELDSVYKKYQMGEVTINALDGVSFNIEQGELCMVVGPSGAGKTTVLNILGGIDDCDDGKIRVGGELVNQFNQKRLAMYRRHDVGFVFQFYNLVPNLTALENVELASQISNKALNPVRVLERVGLSDRMDNFPSQLSGGEQQRVSIARALTKNPKLLLCDEPTGALDYNTGKQILQLLQDTSRETGMTVVIITHNIALTPMADRVITMRNGKVHRIAINDNPLPVDRIEW